MINVITLSTLCWHHFIMHKSQYSILKMVKKVKIFDSLDLSCVYTHARVHLHACICIPKTKQNWSPYCSIFSRWENPLQNGISNVKLTRWSGAEAISRISWILKVSGNPINLTHLFSEWRPLVWFRHTWLSLVELRMVERLFLIDSHQISSSPMWCE